MCTPVLGISPSSCNTAARSPEMKDENHYKCNAKYTEQILTLSYAWIDLLCTYLGGIYIQTN